MSCTGEKKNQSEVLARASKIAGGQVSGAAICLYPGCNRALNAQQECPAGHSQCPTDVAQALLGGPLAQWRQEGTYTKLTVAECMQALRNAEAALSIATQLELADLAQQAQAAIQWGHADLAEQEENGVCDTWQKGNGTWVAMPRFGPAFCGTGETEDEALSDLEQMLEQAGGNPLPSVPTPMEEQVERATRLARLRPDSSAYQSFILSDAEIATARQALQRVGLTTWDRYTNRETLTPHLLALEAGGGNSQTAEYRRAAEVIYAALTAVAETEREGAGPPVIPELQAEMMTAAWVAKRHTKKKESAAVEPLPRELLGMPEAEFQDIVDRAVDWYYLRVQSGGMATKSECELWLMAQYNLTPTAAREVTNFAESHDSSYRIGSGAGNISWRSRERPAPTTLPPLPQVAYPVALDGAVRAARRARRVDDLPRYPGQEAYRAPTGYEPERGATAADVVRFEMEELGNDLVVSPAIRAALGQFPATRLVWVARTPGVAARYGERAGHETESTPVETLAMGEPDLIVATDGEDGYLVLRG